MRRIRQTNPGEIRQNPDFWLPCAQVILERLKFSLKVIKFTCLKLLH
jgi:hypothetical protein